MISARCLLDRKVFHVRQTLVLQPENVQVGLVAIEQLLVRVFVPSSIRIRLRPSLFAPVAFSDCIAQ